MKRLAAAFALLAVFALTFLFFWSLLIGASVPYRGIWLPMAFSVSVGMLLAYVPTLGNSWLRVLTGLTFGLGVVGLWCRSQPILGYDRWLHLAGLATQTLLFFAFICAIVMAIALARRDGDDRPPLLPLCLLLGLSWIVAYVSGSKGGADPMIDAIMRTFHVARPTAETVTICIRKTIHFTFYGLTGLNAFFLARKGGVLRSAAFFGLAMAACQASFDELRQSGFTNRTGSFWDVLLDCAGACVFVWIASRLSERRTASGNTLPA